LCSEGWARMADHCNWAQALFATAATGPRPCSRPQQGPGPVRDRRNRAQAVFATATGPRPCSRPQLGPGPVRSGTAALLATRCRVTSCPPQSRSIRGCAASQLAELQLGCVPVVCSAVDSDVVGAVRTSLRERMFVMQLEEVGG